MAKSNVINDEADAWNVSLSDIENGNQGSRTAGKTPQTETGTGQDENRLGKAR